KFNEGAFTFYFGTTKPQDVTAGLLYGELRYTERAVRQSVLDAEYGSISRFAHALTTSSVFGNASPINTTFFHRTGLLGTQFAEQKFKDPIREFHTRYSKIAGGRRDIDFVSLPGEAPRLINREKF